MTAAQRLAPKCAACGSKDEVEESMCAACYTAMPMDEWVSAERLASMGRHPSNTPDYIGEHEGTPCNECGDIMTSKNSNLQPTWSDYHDDIVCQWCADRIAQ